MPYTSFPPSAENRDRTVRFRLSEREYTELAQEADAAHLPMAALLRGLIAEGRRSLPARDLDAYADRVATR